MKFSRKALSLCFWPLIVMMGACNLSDPHVSSNDFPDTMTKMQQELTKKGYQVTRVQALDQGLAKAGYDIARYRIIFFGDPLDFDVVQQRFPELSVFLPLSITVYEDGEKVHLLPMPFELIKRSTDNDESRAMVSRWQADVDAVMDSAVRPLP